MTAIIQCSKINSGARKMRQIIDLRQIVLISLMVLASAEHMLMNNRQKPLAKGCVPVSKYYIPSAVELEWYRNISSWQQQESTYCARVRQYAAEFTDVMDRIESNRTSPTLYKHRMVQDRLFSMFIHSHQCGSNIVRYATLIEPLVAALRHPLALCALDKSLERQRLLSRDYIMLEPSYGLQQELQPRMLIEHRKAILFDLGASTFLKGWGGASQKVMLESYAAKGVKFDRILLWEAGMVDPKELYRDLPPELFASYQVGRSLN
jgi:hypothetical protein